MSKRPSIRRSPAVAGRGPRGFALIEALVAFLIVSFGILGVVGLQATMARAATGSKARADAAYLAQQVIGSAWADRANLVKYSTANCATHAPCADWKTKVAGTLPSGDAVVAVNAATGQLSVQVTWTAPNEPTHTYATVTTVTP
jgi:type IV pilus assembly protein PilV